ncbi:hypothetical protein, conserved [Plasmodium malariae]|uniref:Uncharacterized protein n=1 Tax=Plasmodium malariae TaxID=5858 RepID=A0A1A8X983_PLAMA|nr:hypothetical protein, conserved [Plasmodium malariae]
MSLFDGMLIKSFERKEGKKYSNENKKNSSKKADIGRNDNTKKNDSNTSECDPGKEKKKKDPYHDLVELLPSYYVNNQYDHNISIDRDDNISRQAVGNNFNPSDNKNATNMSRNFEELNEIDSVSFNSVYYENENNAYKYPDHVHNYDNEKDSSNRLRNESNGHNYVGICRRNSNESSMAILEDDLRKEDPTMAKRKYTIRSFTDEDKVGKEGEEEEEEYFTHNDKEQLNDMLTRIEKVFKNNTGHFNVNDVKEIFEKLFENRVRKKMLITLYYYICHSYMNRKILNLKEEYICDMLIYKFLLNVHKIRKKRKRYKEQEKIMIINEKLDVADVIQNKIHKYSSVLMQNENYITQMFEKKKYIYSINRMLKNYVHNILNVILHNIIILKKNRKKNQRKYLDEKKKELLNQELKIIEKEKEVIKEEQDIQEREKKIQKENEDICKSEEVISVKYDQQINKINEDINLMDVNIKELEKKIELIKIEKLNALKRRNQIEGEKQIELGLVLQKKSKIHTSMNFLKNTLELVNEKKTFIINEKERMKEDSAILCTIYKRWNEKFFLTNQLISALRKSIERFSKDYDHMSISDCHSITVSTTNGNPLISDGKSVQPVEQQIQQGKNENTNIQMVESNVSETQNMVPYYEQNEGKSKGAQKYYSYDKGQIVDNEQNNDIQNFGKIKERCKNVVININVSYSIKKIYFLKKKILELEKVCNYVKEKKKKLMIDINQCNCELDNINIKKENLKNKKKILLKSKMLNEVKNTINEFDELLKTENTILKQLENSKNDMTSLKKQYLIYKEKKERVKKKLSLQERKLLKSEMEYVERFLSSVQLDEKIKWQFIESNDLTKTSQNCMIVKEGEAEQERNNEEIRNMVKVDSSCGKEEKVKDCVAQIRCYKNGEEMNARRKEENSGDKENFLFSEDSDDTEKERNLRQDVKSLLHELENGSSGSEKEEISNDEKEDVEVEIDKDNENVGGVESGKGSDDDGELDTDEAKNSENKNTESQSSQDERGEGEKEGEEEQQQQQQSGHSEGEQKDKVGTDESCTCQQKYKKKNILSEENSNNQSMKNQPVQITYDTDSIIINNDPRLSGNYDELLNVMKKLKEGKSDIFEKILERYKTIYSVNENIDYNMLEQEITNFYNDVVKEENILKTKKLSIIKKKKNLLKKYYSYTSDNSDEEELNM